MDLELSDDQMALRDGIRSLLEGRFQPDRVRLGFDREMFSELEGAGVLSLVDDGFSWADAAVVFEELGRFVVPGPIVDTLVARTAGVGRDGVVGVVEALGSEPAVVEHLDHLDALLVLLGDGGSLVAAAGLDGDPSPWPLDPLTPVTSVAALPAGERVLDSGAVDAVRAQGAVLTAAFCVGMSDRLTSLSVEYAKQREQFDRPIGSFQTVKHILADMLVRTEVARAAVYAAAANLDDPGAGDLARSVATAKVVAGEAAIANGKAATQVHGGMGYVWEVDVHLYLKRAWVLDTHFGSADAHADALGASLTA